MYVCVCLCENKCDQQNGVFGEDKEVVDEMECCEVFIVALDKDLKHLQDSDLNMP